MAEIFCRCAHGVDDQEACKDAPNQMSSRTTNTTSKSDH